MCRKSESKYAYNPTMGRNKRSGSKGQLPAPPAGIRALLPRALGRLRTTQDGPEPTAKPRSNQPKKSPRTSSAPSSLAMGCLLQTSAFSENPAGTVPARNTQSSRCIRTAKKTTSLSDPCLSRDTSRGTSDSSRDDGRRVERKIPDSPVVDADRCQDPIDDPPLSQFDPELTDDDDLIGHPDLEEEQRASVDLDAGYNMFEDMTSLYRRVSRMTRHQVEKLLFRTCITLRQRDFALLAKYERDREQKIHLEKISQSPNSHRAIRSVGTHQPVSLPGTARDDITEENRYLREKLFRLQDEKRQLKRQLQQERDLTEFIRNEALAAEVNHASQVRKHQSESDDTLAKFAQVFSRSHVVKVPMADVECPNNDSPFNAKPKVVTVVTEPTRIGGRDQTTSPTVCDNSKRDGLEKMLLYRKNMTENKLSKRESPKPESQGTYRKSPSVLDALSDCLMTNKSVLNGNHPKHKVTFATTVKYLNGEEAQKNWDCDLQAPKSILKANPECPPTSPAEDPTPMTYEGSARTSTRTEFFAVQREQRLTRWKSAASPSTSDEEEGTIVLEINGSKVDNKRRTQRRAVLPLLGLATNTSFLLENIPRPCKFEIQRAGIAV